MKHKGTQVIETKNLVLRPFEHKDIEAVYKNWTSDPEVTQYLTWNSHKSLEDSEQYVYECITNYNEHENFYNWAIVLKEIDEPIGSIGAVNVDDFSEKVEVGYCIGRNWWNKGIMTEALGAVIDYFFNEIGTNRIEAKHDIVNVASGKVMIHCGLKYEGRQKQSQRNNRGLIDVDLYGLISSDYRRRSRGNKYE